MSTKPKSATPNSKKKPEVEVEEQPKSGKGVFVYSEFCKYDGEWQEVKRELTPEEQEKLEQMQKEKKKPETKKKEEPQHPPKEEEKAAEEIPLLVKKRHGMGVYIDGPMRYEGQWNFDLMEGKGKITFPSGAIYEGDFKANKMEGMGKYVWPDGAIYEGSWKNNKMHGEGVFTGKDGKKWQGTFYNGVGEGIDRQLVD